jgi:hypothetical protein
MNDSRTLQELLEIVKKQEGMIVLMETLQGENEKLNRELEDCSRRLKQKTKKLKESLALNEKLNNENRRLLQQIESWNSLQP